MVTGRCLFYFAQFNNKHSGVIYCMYLGVAAIYTTCPGPSNNDSTEWQKLFDVVAGISGQIIVTCHTIVLAGDKVERL